MSEPEWNEYLEMVSDKIRRGEPVGLVQALAAIDYQQALQAYAKHNVWWRRLGRWIRGQA